MNPNRIVDMASAFYESAALFAASDLGVFKKLAELGRADLAGWLAEAGFRDFSTRPLAPPMPHWLASARK